MAGVNNGKTPLTHDEILQILGNGDISKGSALLQKLSKGLQIARQKHCWGKDNETDSCFKAYIALWDEINEWDYAIGRESKERQDAEAFDVLVVATRIANREWE